MDRTFLPDDAVEAFLHASNDYVTALGAPALAQIDASARDLAEALPTVMVRAAEAGQQVTYAHLPEDVANRKRVVIPAVRMVLAAMSTPAAWICPHFAQISPGMIFCDPPIFACMRAECLRKAQAVEAEAGHRWEQQCDACGNQVDELWPVVRTVTLMSVTGHLCKACVEGGQLDVDVYGKGVVREVGRRQPCPCGSGRRYKACHGRAAA